MSNESEDFWAVLEPAAIVTPASILKTQGAILSEKTKHLLQGEVETWTVNSQIYHRFNIVVPALENYRYSLLRFHHPPTLYPIVVDESPVNASAPDITLSTKLASERSFREWLRTALSAPETTRILQNLMAQARD